MEMKVTFIQWWIAWFLSAIFLLCVGFGIVAAAPTGEACSAAAGDPRLDMVTALKATGPHPSLGDHASFFGR
jgi:hypothetical protein